MMARVSMGEREVVALINALPPVIAAVERAGTKVDHELGLALMVFVPARRREAASSRRTHAVRVVEAGK